METTEDQIERYLRSREIAMPARAFIRLVSNLYHQFEAGRYDVVHEEIFETQEHWADCLRAIEPDLPDFVRVLDVGAGTGYASRQVLSAFGPRVSWLVCQDLSPDMAAQCRVQVQRAARRACFVAGEVEALRGEGAFDLIVTNSVLHHLPDLSRFFAVIRQLIRPGGYYVAGHEPSNRFYANRALYRWTQRYRLWRRARRACSAEPYLRRLRRTPTPRTVEQLTNDALVRLGAIPEALPSGVIPQLVDIHVPRGPSALPFWGEHGFNAEMLQRDFLPDYELRYLTTYPHIKDARARMGGIWRAIDRRLAVRWPDAGANFLMAVRRPMAPGPKTGAASCATHVSGAAAKRLDTVR